MAAGAFSLPQQLGQLGDVGGNPPRGEQGLRIRYQLISIVAWLQQFCNHRSDRFASEPGKLGALMKLALAALLVALTASRAIAADLPIAAPLPGAKYFPTAAYNWGGGYFGLNGGYGFGQSE
jgi:hypothetical protein